MPIVLWWGASCRNPADAASDRTLPTPPCADVGTVVVAVRCRLAMITSLIIAADIVIGEIAGGAGIDIGIQRDY